MPTPAVTTAAVTTATVTTATVSKAQPLPRSGNRGRILRLGALVAAALSCVVLIAGRAAALEPGKDGYVQTGTATRKKLGSNTYNIYHSIKGLPASKSKQALIEAEADKRLTLVFLPVPALLKPIVGTAWPKDKMVGSFKEAFALNGYQDAAKIEKFLAAITQDLHDKDSIVIQYNAQAKTTTITTKAGKASVEGADFMQAVWSLWFGKIEQKGLGEALAAKWLEER